MNRSSMAHLPTLLRSHRFLGTTLLGGVTVSLAFALGSQASQLALIGTWISLLSGLVLASIADTEHHARSNEQLLQLARIPAQLADRPDTLRLYLELAESMTDLASQIDPLLIEITDRKLQSVNDQVDALSRGEVIFSNTETWRTVYEQMLSSDAISAYRSIAWFRSEEYWQDQPGQQSLGLNLQLSRKGLDIQRIVIIADHLWPADEAMPKRVILQWLGVQQNAGIGLFVVRESELLHEPELICDLGIYDQRAVGVQQLDRNCKTHQFILLFDESDVAAANDQWQRLKLYAKSYDVAFSEQESPTT